MSNSLSQYLICLKQTTNTGCQVTFIIGERTFGLNIPAFKQRHNKLSHAKLKGQQIRCSKRQSQQNRNVAVKYINFNTGHSKQHVSFLRNCFHWPLHASLLQATVCTSRYLTYIVSGTDSKSYRVYELTVLSLAKFLLGSLLDAATHNASQHEWSVILVSTKRQMARFALIWNSCLRTMTKVFSNGSRLVWVFLNA